MLGLFLEKGSGLWWWIWNPIASHYWGQDTTEAKSNVFTVHYPPYVRLVWFQLGILGICFRLHPLQPRPCALSSAPLSRRSRNSATSPTIARPSRNVTTPATAMPHEHASCPPLCYPAPWLRFNPYSSPTYSGLRPIKTDENRYETCLKLMSKENNATGRCQLLC